MRLSSLVLTYCLLVGIASAGCAGDPNLTRGDAGSLDAADGSGVGTDAEQDAVACVETNPVVQDGPCDCTSQGTVVVDNLCTRTCDCSGGFWQCDEDCTEPPSLALVFESTPVWTEVTGNGDTAVQAGEVWQVATSLRAANAPEEGVDVDVRVRTDDALLVLDETATVTLEALGATAVPVALEVQIAGAPRTVELEIEASSGFTLAVEPTELQVVGPNAPSLNWGDVTFERIDGNANRDIELGERWQLVTSLANDGDAAATGLSLQARASSAVLAVDAAPVSSPIDIGAGDEATLRWRFTVADELIEVEPLVVLTASADRSADVTQEVVVPLVPPDTLTVGEPLYDEVDAVLTLTVPVTNSASFDISGMQWSRINYTSFCDPAAEPACCGQEGLPECEDPFYRSLNASEPIGPGLLLSGETVNVTMQIPLSGDVPEVGRIVLRASSSLRAHGPFLIDVNIAR